MSIAPLAPTVALQVRQEVLGVEDADDVVEALLEDRKARVAGGDDHLEHLVERVVDVHGTDADARDHHLVDLPCPRAR